MNMDKVVCNCLSVTIGKIKDAIDSGAGTVEEVQDITGAGTVCGACLDDVKRVVEELLAEKS
jgi:NAD(P)H-nitrite reductase large subunit